MARRSLFVSPAMSIAVSFFFLSSLSFAFNVSTLSFDEGYSSLFGHHNIHLSDDRKSVRLLLDRSTGSGFISKDSYHHGFFSAKIKLPSEYTAGVVVAFYTSNGDVFEKTHDELDFEFLGNVRGKEWRVKTNLYGNGSTSRGREESFYVDDVPIREVVKTPAMGGDYPSKPMSLYATIWDGSSWATSGGRYKADYSYAPFVSEFSELVLKGCTEDPIEQVPDKCKEEESIGLYGTEEFSVMTREKREAMQNFRATHMAYSHCYDQARYPTPMPECVPVASEKKRFKITGDSKFNIERKRKYSKKRSKTSNSHRGKAPEK